MLFFARLIYFPEQKISLLKNAIFDRQAGFTLARRVPANVHRQSDHKNDPIRFFLSSFFSSVSPASSCMMTFLFPIVNHSLGLFGVILINFSSMLLQAPLWQSLVFPDDVRISCIIANKGFFLRVRFRLLN